MSTLEKIISLKDYRVFAGPDWPSYENLINKIPAKLPHIQKEVEDFISQMTQTYNEINIDGKILAQNNQQRQGQIFYDKKYRNAIKCQIPWTTMGINSNGNVFICSSPSWIPKFVGNILETNDVYEILNSQIAQDIRQEIDHGRYFYCNNKICSFFSRINPITYSRDPNAKSAAEDFTPMPHVSKDNLKVYSIPKNLIFDFDYTCNFKCPSCRTELINDNKHHIIRPINNQIIDKIKHLVIDNIKSQPIEIRWCGGEPFISDVYLELFDYILASDKTNIKHIIQTNGSYLKSKSKLLSKLLPVTTELRISFDAATENTYQRVRVNGVWNNLLENVKWVKKYVADNNLKTSVSADFVVQLDNYHEIPAFVDLCKQLEIKNINFQKMWNWGTWPQEVFDTKNIFDPSHSKYLELVEMFKQINRPIPF
jgi:sulfatase maturation enzyme AslB (radical SAM superfamily)